VGTTTLQFSDGFLQVSGVIPEFPISQPFELKGGGKGCFLIPLNNWVGIREFGNYPKKILIYSIFLQSLTEIYRELR
jgi:hypothetical protein